MGVPTTRSHIMCVLLLSSLIAADSHTGTDSARNLIRSHRPRGRKLRMHPAPLPDLAVSGWLLPLLAHPGLPTSGQVARAGLPLARGGPTCARGQGGRCRRAARRGAASANRLAAQRAAGARVVKSHANRR